MIKSRSWFGGLSLGDGKIMVIGGTHEGIACKECEEYNIYEKRWISLAPLNEATFDCSACLFGNDFVFKFGGKGS